MNPNQKKRLSILIIGATIVLIGLFWIPSLLKDKAALYLSPDEIKEKYLAAPNEKPERIRLGGYVLEGTVKKSPDGIVSFIVTDFQSEIPVTYKGTPPDLFREGQGVYVEGRYLNSGVFQADALLAKHDENYRPPVPGSEEE